jgi:2-C-methyl-D-erythritol 4-phosphate cytidylyltransferase/2-C-methyl-D-erythritol 2,4-cyclodiphosphate synthase
MHVSAIIAAGGRGVRFGGGQRKQFRELSGRPILQYSIDACQRATGIDDLVVALPADIMASPPAYLRGGHKPIVLVEGGRRRRDSVASAFAKVDGRADLVVIHDAARPLLSQDVIARTIEAAAEHGAAIAALPVADTVKRVGPDGGVAGTLPREEIFLAQTPQVFRLEVLRDALAMDPASDATDEARLAELAGHPVRIVAGDARTLKVTTPEDLEMAERLIGSAADGHGGVAGLRIGNGYDLHRLVEGRPLVLGGVTIPFEKGLDGHSDADAVCHAVTDALLGAAGAGDIGRHFPESDPTWKGADSLALLARSAAIVREAGYVVLSVDAVVVAERPKLAPFIDQMRVNVAAAAGVTADRVSIKGKTNEGADATGAGQAIAVHAVALVARVERRS